jgi:hypothetical protein
MPLNPDLAPQRVVALRPEQALRPPPAPTGEAWRRALTRAGLLAEVGAPAGRGDPRRALIDLQQALYALEAAESALVSLRTVDHRVRFGDAPWWSWLILAAQPVLWLKLADLRGAKDEDAVLLGLWVYLVPALAAALVAVLAWRQAAARRRDRDVRLAAQEAAGRAALAGLELSLAALLGRVFVVPGQGRLLLCADPLTEAAHGARALAEAGREGEAAEAAARVAAAEAALQAALEAEPPGVVLELPGPWGPPS